MLRGGVITEETKRERALHAIHDSAKRQAQIVDELLDVSRIISGKLKLERSAVNWQDIVNAAVEVVQPAAAAKRIDIAASMDPSIGAFYADGARLQQIVWNLLTNAVKFSPDGGSVRVTLRRVANRVELSVTDSGQGIAPDFLPSVFEPFRQADGSTTRRHGGLGLGLSIAKHLVEAHGGTITAASEGEGYGATFAVRLPIVPVHAGESASTEDLPAAPADTAAATSLAGISVLVVDDDDRGREIVAEYLDVRHATVLTAGSAAEALEVLQRTHVDGLLADIAMPGQDGYELIRKVRGMHRGGASSIPAAALTAFARAEDRRKVFEAGFQMHLTKPISLQTLIDAVARLSGRISDEALTSRPGLWDVRGPAEPLATAVTLNADPHRTRATDRRRP
jgi:CheY-like chemotaxis protein/two-component sensor histidine kinase